MRPILLLACALVLLPGVVAADGPARTFFLPPGDTERMDEEPTGSTFAHEGLVVQSRDGARFGRLTVAFTDGLAIAKAHSFHLHLEDRELLVPEAQSVTTEVRLTVRGASGEELRDAHGDAYVLGWARATFLHPGQRNVEAEGWSEFRFDVDDQGLLHADATHLYLPSGSSIVLDVAIVSDEPASGPGAFLTAQGAAVADQIEDIGILPGAGDIDAPILRGVDLEGNVTARLRDPATGRNVDGLAGAQAVPVASFAADDRGSWLRISTAG